MLPGTNVKGTVIIVCAGMPAYLVASAGGLGHAATTIGIGVAVAAVDAAVRRRYLSGWVARHGTGGTFLGMPIWVLGLAWVALGTIWVVSG